MLQKNPTTKINISIVIPLTKMQQKFTVIKN